MNSKAKTNEEKKTIKFSTIIGKYGVYIALVILFVIMAIASPTFLKPTNLLNILKQNAVYGIIAVGMTFVIVTSGIDLGVGAIVAMAGCFSAALSQQGGAGTVFGAYAVGLASGVIAGAFSGFFIAYCSVPAFIGTLATMTICRGIIYVFTDGRPITGVVKAYAAMGSGSIGIVPVAAVIYLLFLIVGHFLLKYTKFGRHVFDVGGNRKAARVSGINVKKTEMLVYVISGFCAAFAGWILASRVHTGHPASGEGFEMNAISGTVIGGTSLAGGRGSVLGSFIGILVLGVLTNGLDLLNVSSYYQQIIRGIIILVAVLSDRQRVNAKF